MEDIVRLGRKMLFWMKLFFVLLVAFFVLRIALGATYSNVLYTSDSFLTASGAGVIILMLAFLLVCICVLLGMAVLGLYVLIWTYRATANLRLKATTALSPIVSVLGLLIPAVNVFVQFGILRNLAHVQETLLADQGAKVPSVPLRKLTIWLVLTIAAFSMLYFEESNLFYVAYGVCALSSFGCIMSVFTAVVAQHEALFQMEQERILSEKVDDVLRKREIERLASEIQQAKYESEK